MWNYFSIVKYEMENEKDLIDSEIESDLEEDIVFGKLFVFSRDWVFIVLTVLIMNMFDILLWKQ